MRAAGALFGLMVESLRDVLMSRAAVKSEFGLEQTMLRPRENNALKFSITPADAIAALLQPGQPGYMDPLRATREAFDDVRVHQSRSWPACRRRCSTCCAPSTRPRSRPACRRAA